MTRPRAAKICSQPGCPNDQPCPDHHRQPWAGRQRRSSHGAGWDAKRRAVKRRDRNTCQICFGARCGNAQLEVDMITPEAEGGTTDLDNLQLAGKACHDAKSAAEAARGRKRARGR